MISRFVFFVFVFCLYMNLIVASTDTFLINYDGVNIQKVTQDIAKFSNKTIILDPRLKGNVTIFSDSYLTKDQVWEVYLRTLQSYGYSVISNEDIVHVIPEAKALKDNVDRLSKANFQTKVFLLHNRSSTELIPMIKPLMGQYSTISKLDTVNCLLLVDKKSNLLRIGNVIKQLDNDVAAKVSVIRLNKLSAIEAVAILNQLKNNKNPKMNEFTVIAFPISNSIILSAKESITQELNDTIVKLDQDTLDTGSETIIFLKYAKAETLVPILEKVISKFDLSTSSVKPVITYHEKTNSLVISADSKNSHRITNLVSQLDVQRAQVLVEAIVVEISESNDQSFGVETAASANGSGYLPAGITRFPNSNSVDLISIAGAVADGSASGVSATSIQSLLNTKGIAMALGKYNESGQSFAAIIQALKEDRNSNILSTPSIIALNNEKARLIIGQEISIVTGESLSSNNSNPFRTTTREDVGIKLSIVPQINENDSILLDIDQEVSSISNVSLGVDDRIINKREISTKVLAKNNQTIVLGGLIDETVEKKIQKVPLLSSLPFLGKLFKSSSDSKVKRNLIVFIRPTILRDFDSINPISDDLFDDIYNNDSTQKYDAFDLLDSTKK